MTVTISPPLTRESIFLPAAIIYWTSRVYSIYNFTIIGAIHDGKTSVRILDRLIVIFNLVLCSIVTWINMNYDLQGIASTSEVITAANNLSLFVEILATMLLTIRNFFLMGGKKVWKVFSKMDKFDKRFRMIFTKDGYNAKEFRFIRGFVIIFFTTLTICTLADFYVVSSAFGTKFALLKVAYYFAVLGPHWAFLYSYILLFYLISNRLNNLRNCFK